ncbi:hypothetical protein ACHQM5_000133 [Ranunculus cassubicifolius]
MDHPIQIVKLKEQVRNKYKKKEFSDTLILYCFIVLSCCLLCSTPFWLPSLVSSSKAFIFVSVPSIGALLFTPKCLFVVCNIIIIILIGESKYVGSSSSTDNEIYHEYVKRTATVRTQPKPEKQEVVDTKFEITTIAEEKENINEEQGNGGEANEVETVKEDEFGDGEEKEEDVALPAEELNKKFDDFIAKVNNQRRLEARQLVCV